MTMICTEERLDRALKNYKRYLPTASNHLVASRSAWIPVVIDGLPARYRVRACAEMILDGEDYAEKYRALPESHRLGVALCLMVAWSDILAEMVKNGATTETTLTTRVFRHLAGLSVDWQAIAVRNWGERDGGRVNALEIIRQLQLTKVPVLMEVYVSIYEKWQQAGSDWDRRRREEAELVQTA